ncbi:MAG: hypothetical protein QOE20_3882 [Mycobacterium sp.]|jgi:hypothetical protein|nr:hypothetical protein [Mycobacterium sp.]
MRQSDCHVLWIRQQRWIVNVRLWRDDEGCGRVEVIDPTQTPPTANPILTLGKIGPPTSRSNPDLGVSSLR